MKMKKLARSLFAAAALTAAGVGAASASIVVDYQVTNYSGAQPGTFSGIDANSDGVLSFSELTSFQFDNINFGHHVTLATLSGFGDFNYVTDTWTANGFGWGTNHSFFSWNTGANSVDGTWAQVSTTVVSGNSIPEPGSLALLGISLAGLATTLGRKKRQA
jgi:hypothetical protein